MSLVPFTIIQCSNFNGLNRSEAGEDMDRVLDQRAECGFNYTRDWTAFNIDRIGRLIPRERPGLYDHIPVYLQKAARRGLYVELTIGTGPWGGIFDNDDQKFEHSERVKAAVAGITNVSIEEINEADYPPNQPWPVARATQPNGGLSSHGSNSIDADPVTPVWRIAGFHPGPDPRKVGHNAMERADMFHIPIWSGETVRYPDNDSSDVHAYDAARAAALLCAGSCFHSVRGKTAQLWDGQELVCAQAWARGARSVDLRYQVGRYARHDERNTDTIVRVYSRTVDGLGQCFAEIHA
jgi:hypothetical protein